MATGNFPGRRALLFVLLLAILLVVSVLGHMLGESDEGPVSSPQPVSEKPQSVGEDPPDTEYTIPPVAVQESDSRESFVKGRVYCLDSERPIPDAKILIRPCHDSASSEVSSNTDGAYQSPALSEGRYTLSCTLPVNAPFRPANQAYEVVLEVTAGETFEGVDFGYLTATYISGTVTDTGGEAIADAAVVYINSAVRGAVGGPSPATSTDENGHFFLAGLPSGTTIGLFVVAKGFLRCDVPGIQLPVEGGVDDVHIVLNRGGRLSGFLLNQDDQPVQASLSLSGKGLGAYSDDSRTDGSFSFDGLPGGDYRIEALPLGYSSPVRRGGYPIVPDGLLLAEGEVIEGFVIRMDEVEVTFVSGLLVDHEGTPVPNALINPLGRNCLGTRSDEEGGFTFPCDVSEGLVDIGIRTEDPMRFYLKEQVAIGATDVVIRLDAPVTVTGTVLSGRGGSPVTAFEYQLSTVPETPDFVPSPIVGTVYSSGGTFAIEDVPPRPFSLSIWAPGYARTTQDVPRVVPGQTIALTVVLGGGAVLTGEVVDSRGNPVVGARVTALSDAGPCPDGVTTDARGAFRIENLSRGAWVIEVFPSRDFVPAAREVVVSDTAPTHVVIELGLGALVHGVVTYDNQGAAGVRVQLLCPVPGGDPDVFRTTQTDPDGYYEFDDVPTGEYTCLFFTDNGFVKKTLDVIAGLDYEVNHGG